MAGDIVKKIKRKINQRNCITLSDERCFEGAPFPMVYAGPLYCGDGRLSEFCLRLFFVENA